MNYKRVVLLAGHYGSGKTNIAVNIAFEMRSRFDRVAIADLDIVNPYFRTKDSAAEFEKAGISLISSAFAGSNVDLPALPQEVYSITDDRTLHAVMDVGGDDRGALALGRYTPFLRAEDDYEMLFVINRYRPLTRDAESALQILREVERAGGLPFTAIVNNSNLGEETSPEDVLASLRYADEVAQKTGLPIKMTTVKESLVSALSGRIENLYPLKLQKKIK